MFKLVGRIKWLIFLYRHIVKRLIFIYTHDPLKEILKENRYITSREADEILGNPPRIGGYWPENKKGFAEAYEKCFTSRWP